MKSILLLVSINLYLWALGLLFQGGCKQQTFDLEDFIGSAKKEHFIPVVAIILKKAKEHGVNN